MNETPSKPTTERAWLKGFDERQQKQIALSEIYAQDFHHGAEGHNNMMIIAQMAAKLDEYARKIVVAATEAFEKGPQIEISMGGKVMPNPPITSEILCIDPATGEVIVSAFLSQEPEAPKPNYYRDARIINQALQAEANLRGSLK